MDVLERALESRAADEQADRRPGRCRQGRGASGAPGSGDARARRDHRPPRCDRRPDARCAGADAPAGQRSCRRARRAERRPRRHGDTEASGRHPRAQGRNGGRTKSIDEPLEIEANAEVDVDIADVATVRIRGGRREAQQTVESLEERWEREVAPHLAAANVTDLDALGAKVEEARALDASIVAKDAELESLRVQIASLAGSADALREASERATTARAALGDVSLDTLASDLAALGADPTDALRKRRQQLSTDVEAARAVASQCWNGSHARGGAGPELQSCAGRGGRRAGCRIGGIPGRGDASAVGRASFACRSFGGTEEDRDRGRGVGEHDRCRGGAHRGGRQRYTSGGRTRAGLQSRARKRRRKGDRRARIAVGRLEELRRQRDAQDLAGAENRLREATERHAAVPVPERLVTDVEVTAARNAEASARADLERIVREIHRTHGALEQVGGVRRARAAA